MKAAAVAATQPDALGAARIRRLDGAVTEKYIDE